MTEYIGGKGNRLAVSVTVAGRKDSNYLQQKSSQPSVPAYRKDFCWRPYKASIRPPTTTYDVSWTELSFNIADCRETSVATMGSAQEPIIKKFINNESLDPQNHLLIKRQQYNLVPYFPWFVPQRSDRFAIRVTTRGGRSYIVNQNPLSWTKDCSDYR